VSLLISVILIILAWLPLQLVRLLRAIQRRGTVVVRLRLGGPRDPSTSAAHADRNARLRELAADVQVSALFIRLEGVPGGWAELQELRASLRAVRDSGKLVIIYLEQASNAGLYLASVASRVWMPPVGELFLSGLGGRLMFFGNLLDRLGVQVDFEAAGDYKSFGEPFTRGFASRANREQLEALYGDLQQQLIAGIAEGRDLSEEAAGALLGSSPLSAEEARTHGLIDAVFYSDQLSDALEDVLDTERLRVVRFGSYLRLARLAGWLLALGRRRALLAVVHLEGSIVLGGDAPQGRRIASRDVVPLLRQLRSNDRVRAVVLRIDSGGGSALASDLIAREVRKLGEEKPVIASFGNIVASGGYYLAVVARELIAQPGTITGSIGVFGGKVVLSDALARQGLTGDVVEVGPDVGFLGPWRPFTDAQRARFREYLDKTYALFLDIVAGGRRCPVAAILPAAGGRVWTGVQAKELSLIDHFGGMPLALSRARLLAGLSPEQGHVVHLDFTPTRLQTLSALASSQARRTPLDVALMMAGPHAELLRLIRQQPGQALALSPWVIDDDPTR
jgi:protease-4